MNTRSFSHLVLLIAALLLTACSAPKESQVALAVQNVESYKTNYTGPRYPMVVGNFENKTQYHKGIFYEGEGDQIGHQAKQILKTHLVATNALDRHRSEDSRVERVGRLGR